MTLTLLWAVEPEKVLSFHEVYAQSMRGSLFTGFLTLGSFLLAAKTLLVIQFRKDVFEQEDYYDAFLEQGAKGKVFDRLERLANLLNLNILLALTTSVIQFSLGFVNDWLVTSFCLLMPTITIALTAVSVIKVRKNLAIMFKWLNVKADKYLTNKTGKQPPGKSAN